MTNTIPNVPRELLERLALSEDLFNVDQAQAVSDLRALLSAPSPAATDQARACSLEMKAHCVELYRDAPELHEVVLASEALAACAARDARIVELESGQSADMFLTLTGEITQLRAELAAIKAQEPVAFDVYDDDSDQLAHTVRADDAKRVTHYRASPGAWRLISLYAAPVSEAKAQGVVMPERANASHGSHDHQSGWNACMDEIARLNAAPVQQASVPASAFASRAITHYEAALLAAFPSGSSGEVFNQWNEARRVLAAAPAAPAADAGVTAHD